MSEEEPKVKDIPPYSNGMQYLCVRKTHTFAEPYLGKKAIQNEIPYNSIIGDNPSICHKLAGLGLSGFSKVRFQGQSLKDWLGLNDYSHHVWIPQINESDPEKKIMHTCLDCGSISIFNDKEGKRTFYSYLDIERYEKSKKKIKKAKK